MKGKMKDANHRPNHQAISQDYRASYLSAYMHQPVAFFDFQAHSPSKLIGRLSTEPDAIHKFIGNISVIVTVFVCLISTVALALVTGWQFALVVLASGLPIIFAANFVRERMENTFEEKAGAIFTDCVGYAGEYVEAIRTVASLNMEDHVAGSFGALLATHCQTARKHALTAMVWFALSEAVDLLCMALAFW